MPLKTIGTIAVPDAMGSEFDHAAFDARSRRVFIAHTARTLTGAGAHTTALVAPDQLYVISAAHGGVLILSDA